MLLHQALLSGGSPDIVARVWSGFTWTSASSRCCSTRLYCLEVPLTLWHVLVRFHLYECQLPMLWHQALLSGSSPDVVARVWSGFTWTSASSRCCGTRLYCLEVPLTLWHVFGQVSAGRVTVSDAVSQALLSGSSPDIAARVWSGFTWTSASSRCCGTRLCCLEVPLTLWHVLGQVSPVRVPVPDTVAPGSAVWKFP